MLHTRASGNGSAAGHNMTDAELTVYTDQGGPFDSSTLQPIMWDGNAGGLEGHLHQLDDWTDESKFRQLMSTGVATTLGGNTICDTADIPNIIEKEREISLRLSPNSRTISRSARPSPRPPPLSVSQRSLGSMREKRPSSRPVNPKRASSRSNRASFLRINKRHIWLTIF